MEVVRKLMSFELKFSTKPIYTSSFDIFIVRRCNIYALRVSRCSQQLQAIANPSEEEVALPSSSITTRLLKSERPSYDNIKILSVNVT